MIRLFLDSEWANDALRELVSLALISENGEHVFYAERDPLPGMPSGFVRENVYPLLSRGAAAMDDNAMTHVLRSFLEPLGACEVFADAPLDFSMLSRVWNGRDEKPPAPPFRKRLAREGNLMPSVERYFELNPDQRARRHHALVDAMALRWAWMVENYSFDGDVGDAESYDHEYDQWLRAKIDSARVDSRPSISHDAVKKALRVRLDTINAKKKDEEPT